MEGKRRRQRTRRSPRIGRDWTLAESEGEEDQPGNGEECSKVVDTCSKREIRSAAELERRGKAGKLTGVASWF